MMKNVHVGWGPVGLTLIKDRAYIRLNYFKLSGVEGSSKTIQILSKHDETPIWQSKNEEIATVD